MGSRSEERIVERLQVVIKVPGEVWCRESTVSQIYLILQASPVVLTSQVCV